MLEVIDKVSGKLIYYRNEFYQVLITLAKVWERLNYYPNDFVYRMKGRLAKVLGRLLLYPNEFSLESCEC